MLTTKDTRAAGDGKTFGLIAGGGSLPAEFIRHAPAVGIARVVAVGFKDYTLPEVASLAALYEEIGIGQLGRLIKFFSAHGVHEAVMLGSLSPRLTVANVRLDWRMIMLAARVRDRRADSVLGAIAAELAKDGITLQDTTTCLPHLLAEKGPMGKRKPGSRELEDIKLGIKIALASGGLDIGQTAIVRKHAIIAVEAMEGTDACIKRAGSLTGGVVVVKMAKPKQDPRFDVPCIGPGTIEAMIEAEAAVLAVEAGRTFLLEKQRTIKVADQHGIALVGVSREETGD